jgi:hypothetical protein
VRIYSASREEGLRARALLRDWAAEGFLTGPQYERLDKETISDLRTTNIYLRLVLFLFTLISIGGAAALFFELFLSHPSDQTTGGFLLIFAAACYAAAEFAASKIRLYRFGIEEALAACAVGFLCVGVLLAFFGDRSYSGLHQSQAFVIAIGAGSSLWIWRRFGYSYALLAAMVFVVFLPGCWTLSQSAERGVIGSFYAVGVAGIAAMRSHHSFDYLEDHYSLAEALLWLGIYLALNLRILSLIPRPLWWAISPPVPQFPKPFYWTTWVLIWCLPVMVLVRGIRLKDRFIIAIGGVIAVLTLVSNKPYLGWPRHTWDPMILGVVLSVVALFIRRWLSSGPNGIRHGFTAARISARDRQLANAASAALGLVSPHAVTAGQQTPRQEVHFEGGRSGGGGASGRY